MDKDNNYLVLGVTFLVTFVCFVAGVSLLVFLLQFLFIPVFKMRWFELLFYLSILSSPFVLFEFVHIVFFKRTRHHPSSVIRVISRVLFLAGMAYCALYYVLDLISFFNREYTAVNQFRTFDLRFLCINIFGLFAIAILQAATTAKEKDWMER